MNSISGTVVVKGTDVGVSGVMVQAYDTAGAVTLPAHNGHSRTTLAARVATGKLGRSLGTAVTRNGLFEIQYDDDALREAPSIPATEGRSEGRTEAAALNWIRPDILVVVLAPEDPDSTVADRVLHVAEMRPQAGRTEEFRFSLRPDLLKTKAVPVRTVSEVASHDPVPIIEAAKVEAERRDAIDVGLRALAVERVNRERDADEKARQTWSDKLVVDLNRAQGRADGGTQYVAPGGDAVKATLDTMQTGLEKRVHQQASEAGYVQLTPEQVQAMRDAHGGSLEDLPAEDVELLFFGSPEGPTRAASLLREDPIAATCKAHRIDDPVDPPAPAPAPGPSPAPAPAPGPFSEADVKELLARLLGPVVAPEEFSMPPRADAEQVGTNINNLSLRQGPADVPAFYDFHRMQIAFDYVWQHAIDEGVLTLGERVVRQIETLGGDPVRALGTAVNPLRALRTEMATTLRSQQSWNNRVLMRRANDGLPDPDESLPRPPRPRPIGGTFPGDILVHPTDWVIYPPFDPSDLLAALEQRLREPYAFTIYAPNSINFGLLTTYRQKWEPLTYQAGRLVKTLTLTPKESRKVTMRTVIKRRRAEREAESSQSTVRDEFSDTYRDEAEVIARAETKTNFSLTTQGSYKLGALAEGDATTVLGTDSGSGSQDTKRQQREAVRKAAQELRSSKEVKVEFEESFESEVSETTEISNPNSEVSVAYLFYELQRRYMVSEALYRAVPVVLVAQAVPAPHEIDKDWLIAHDWIIKRFLPDDSFLPALNYVSTRVRGDELALDHLRANLDLIRTTVQQLKQSLVEVHNSVRAGYTALETAIADRIAAVKSDSGLGNWIGDLFTEDEDSKEAAQMKEQAAREAYERLAKEEKEMQGRLEREVTALQTASDVYAKAYAEHTNQMVQVARLALHVKNEIFRYMQAVWAHEHPDQRFFRLHNIKVARLKAARKTYTLTEMDHCPLGVTPKPGYTCFQVEAFVEMEPVTDPESEFATLAEIADLDNPLGFKGNYAIFPLRESNALTDYMLMPYVDAEMGLRDPDEYGNWTLEQFADYVKCLRETLPPERFAEVADELRKQYKKMLSSPRRDREEIVVPTESLFIENLVSTNPVMEDYQRFHRIMDMKKVAGEVRQEELENVLRAARLIAGEREDPRVDRKIVIEGERHRHAARPVSGGTSRLAFTRMGTGAAPRHARRTRPARLCRLAGAAHRQGRQEAHRRTLRGLAHSLWHDGAAGGASSA